MHPNAFLSKAFIVCVCVCQYSPKKRTLVWRRIVCRGRRYRTAAGRRRNVLAYRTWAPLRAPAAHPGQTGTSAWTETNITARNLVFLKIWRKNWTHDLTLTHTRTSTFLYISQQNVFDKPQKTGLNVMRSSEGGEVEKMNLSPCDCWKLLLPDPPDTITRLWCFKQQIAASFVVAAQQVSP